MSETARSGLSRVYRSAGVEQTADGFQIVLDGKPLRTPGKAPLAVPTRALAEAIAAEWEAQGEKIEPDTMPLTRLANTVIDGLIGQEEAIRDDIAAYAANDLLYYRAGEPEGLVLLQQSKWDPVLSWARNALDARFILAEGVIPVEQPAETMKAVRRALQAYDGFALAPMHVMTTLMGSGLLTLAQVRGAISAEEAWEAAHVDENFQISLWGCDREAEARRVHRRAEFDAAVRMLELLGT